MSDASRLLSTSANVRDSRITHAAYEGARAASLDKGVAPLST
jgi:hypothetical protein